MTKVEDLISMNIRFCNIKIAPDQGDQKRIEDIVKKFMKDFISFGYVTLTKFSAVIAWRLQPRQSEDLDDC